jgi:CBS domain-containing protein
MSEYEISHLLIVDGERPVGLIGMADLLRSGVPLGTGVGLGF